MTVDNIRHLSKKTESIMENTFEGDKAYLWSKFSSAVFDSETGLENETIRQNLEALSDKLKALPNPVIKAKSFEYVARNVRIAVSPHDWFVGFGCYDRWNRLLAPLIAKWEHEVDAKHLATSHLIKKQNESAASRLGKDFDHSVPDWDALLSLGFPGIRERSRRYRKEREKANLMTPEARAYFDSIEITYSAILEMLERFKKYALGHAHGNMRVLACAECMDSLIKGPPQSTYEALHFVYLYFMFSEYIDHLQVRSLGNLDRTIYPYYIKDLEENRYAETEIREFFSYFLMQWASIANPWGHPFYFGGTKSNGESEINELSFLILDEFDKLNICSPKLQIKISPNTPAEFIDKAIDMIRRGRSSIVFLCEPSIERAMMSYGATKEEARTCDISGCYEFVPRARGNTTIPGIINMLKQVELVFNDGIDPRTGIDCGLRTGTLEELKTFDDFHSAYIKQLGNTIETIITCVNDFEKYLDRINPSPVFSATIENSLATANDAFHNGSVYNITSILTTGFATAIDALMAVKEYVYETQKLSLTQFKSILHDNWKGHEKLRLKILRNKNKFGNGAPEADFYAETLARFLAHKINLRKNGRNGFYVASLHTPPRTFITFGEKTGATPDGRLAGEELSRNISPTMGMDRNGITALINSVTRIDSADFPGDFPLDVMLHPATVHGREGLAAMRTILNTYMEKHGIAIQFNVFDAETLIDAQKYPSRYQGLQVRVCGWNAYFNDMSRKEQDMFIRRAQNIRS